MTQSEVTSTGALPTLQDGLHYTQFAEADQSHQRLTVPGDRRQTEMCRRAFEQARPG
jgi:hypothetical protein